jgi:hypothetical protein
MVSRRLHEEKHAFPRDTTERGIETVPRWHRAQHNSAIVSRLASGSNIDRTSALFQKHDLLSDETERGMQAVFIKQCAKRDCSILSRCDPVSNVIDKLSLSSGTVAQ